MSDADEKAEAQAAPQEQETAPVRVPKAYSALMLGVELAVAAYLLWCAYNNVRDLREAQ